MMAAVAVDQLNLRPLGMLQAQLAGCSAELQGCPTAALQTQSSRARGCARPLRWPAAEGTESVSVTDHAALLKGSCAASHKAQSETQNVCPQTGTDASRNAKPVAAPSLLLRKSGRPPDSPSRRSAGDFPFTAAAVLSQTVRNLWLANPSRQAQPAAHGGHHAGKAIAALLNALQELQCSMSS